MIPARAASRVLAPARTVPTAGLVPAPTLATLSTRSRIFADRKLLNLALLLFKTWYLRGVCGAAVSHC